MNWCVFAAPDQDTNLETIADLKKIRTFPSQCGPGSWTGLAPGDIPLLVRDTSAQEIYSRSTSCYL